MEKKLKWCGILHRVTVVISFLSVILPILLWKYIPEQIPSHYGGSGEADAWSEKSFMILLFFMVILMLGMMSIAEYYVRSSAMSAKATAAEKGNLEYIYPMIVIMGFVLQITFAYIIFCSAASRNLGAFFLPAVLIATFGPMLYFLPKSMKLSAVSKDQKALFSQRETENTGEVYSSKIDWWLGLLLAGCLVGPLWLFLSELVKKGTFDWILFVTEIFIAALLIPMFRMKYVFYPDHLLVVCIGKERIRYRDITGVKETHNPLSSAALSLDRLQIDYKNSAGGHNMILISPKPKKEFIAKLQEKRALYKE